MKGTLLHLYYFAIFIASNTAITTNDCQESIVFYNIQHECLSFLSSLSCPQKIYNVPSVPHIEELRKEMAPARSQCNPLDSKVIEIHNNRTVQERCSASSYVKVTSKIIVPAVDCQRICEKPDIPVAHPASNKELCLSETLITDAEEKQSATKSTMDYLVFYFFGGFLGVLFLVSLWTLFSAQISLFISVPFIDPLIVMNITPDHCVICKGVMIEHSFYEIFVVLATKALFCLVENCCEVYKWIFSSK